MQAFAGQRRSAALQCPCPRLLVLSEGEGVANSRIGASACMAETIEDAPAAASCPAAISHFRDVQRTALAQKAQALLYLCSLAFRERLFRKSRSRGRIVKLILRALHSYTSMLVEYM